MDLGSGIAFGALCISAASVFITAIRAKTKANIHCADHSGICEKLLGLDAWLSKIERKLDMVISGRRLE